VPPDRIVDLLKPFDLALDELRLNQISIYIDLLVRWNVRINLTAIRDPEEIVTRHFGESLFTAKHLYPLGAVALARPTTDHEGTAERSRASHLIDVGSGPGFPGLPIKIWNPDLQLILIESNQRKATFLREVIRALILTDVNVFSARAETHPPATADVVTLRALERFDQFLPVAAKLVVPGGRLALLIGSAQVDQASRLSPNFDWKPPISIPNSQSRILLLGYKNLDRY
jgi:16S rRNA (guanine527-N7)-methyltransferase